MAFWRNYVHLVWTTKHRQLLIDDRIESRLYNQMVDKAVELGCYVFAINGVADHIHLVLAIPPKHSVSEVVKTIKGASSRFVNQTLPSIESYFQWQRGYGCFSLGHTQLPRAIAYVEAQKERHAKQTTNIWLECASDVDEGPPEIDSTLIAISILREAAVSYDVEDEMPF